MKLKLIPDWKSAYKFVTVWLAVALGLLATAYEYLPAVQSYLPEGWVKWFALLIILGRVLNQNIKEREKDVP
jgi:hypothetical protein